MRVPVHEIRYLEVQHNSRPYNPLTANTFFRAGYIEAWGRGIQKIRESCEENGNEMAEYKVSSSEIMRCIPKMIPKIICVPKRKKEYLRFVKNLKADRRS